MKPTGIRPTRPNFEAFADKICDLFFENDQSAVEYDEFLDAAVATGIVYQAVCDRKNPRHRAVADEHDIEDGAALFLKNFGAEAQPAPSVPKPKNSRGEALLIGLLVLAAPILIAVCFLFTGPPDNGTNGMAVLEHRQTVDGVLALLGVGGVGLGALFAFVVLPVLLFWALVRGIANVFADSYARRLGNGKETR